MTMLSREQLGEYLSAYVDGELSAEQTRLVERVIESDPDARRMLEELRRTVNLVSSLPHHAAPPSILDDVQRHAERLELLGGSRAAPASATRRRFPMYGALSMAATITFVVAGLWYLTPTADFERRTTDRVAEGPSRSVTAEKAADSRELRTESDSARFSESAETAILGSLTFEQKLNANVTVARLVEHRFDNESISLKVPARDDTVAKAVEDNAVRYLAKRGAVELAAASSGPAAPSAQPPSNKPIYFRGTAGVNFVDPRQQQILVRAPRSEVKGLLESLEVEVPDSNQVTLNAGPVAIQGLTNARGALARQAEASGRAVGAADEGEVAGAGAKSEAVGDTVTGELDPTKPDDVLAGILKVFGVDPRLQSAPETTALAEAATRGDAKERADVGHEGKAAKGLAEGSRTRPATRDDRDTVLPAAKDPAARAKTAVPADASVSPDVADENEEGRAVSRSMVDRRFRELKERANRRTATGTGTLGEREAIYDEPIPAGPSPEAQPDDPYVTLVIQMVVEPPAASGARAAPARAVKPAVPKPAESKPKAD